MFISKKFLGELLRLVMDNQDRVALLSPSCNDPLIKVAQELKENNKGHLNSLASLPNYDEKVSLKLKTRLLISYDYKDGAKYKKQVEEKLLQYCRCLACQATLTQEIAVQNFDQSIVRSQYEPQDKQALMTQYCDILKLIDVNPSKDKSAPSKDKGGEKKPQMHEHMSSFIDAAAYVARKQQQYEVSQKIQDFKRKLNIEV